MAEITLDKSKTALLMADFSAGNMAQNPIVHERQTFERAGEVLAAARQAGIFVTYCISHFRPGYPEIPAQHNPRSPLRAAGAVLPADPALLGLGLITFAIDASNTRLVLPQMVTSLRVELYQSHWVFTAPGIARSASAVITGWACCTSPLVSTRRRTQP